ncbi:MAG: PilZ domain-containing protein [candidate division Zixibacteria bacterium]|nr:PilZ domain-containing protein [candidate division Zixibacteria bacterium]
MTRTKSEDQVDGFIVKQPLKLYKSKKRRYVRLEISAPVTLAPIDMDRPLEHLSGNEQTGTILNLSGGGVLLSCDQQVPENSYVVMSFELKDCELLTGIVGKVKRVDDDGEEGCLMGVEFCSESELNEVFGAANLGGLISSFDERIKRTLLKYIFTKKVQQRIEKKSGKK